MDLILYSTAIQSLNSKNATTSSEIFELKFIESMKIYFKNIVILSNACNGDIEYKDNIQLISLGKGKNLYRKIQKKINEYKINLNENTIVLVFGYYYLRIKIWKYLCGKYGTKLISFTFDTHKGALNNKGIVKKFLINYYFHKGIKCLNNNVDGMLLFQENAAKELNLRIPYIVTKVGIDKENISTLVYKRKREKNFKITYAGSLEPYNGIAEMLNMFSFINDQDIELDVYGDGTMKDMVCEKMEEDNRIKYWGCIQNKDIKEKFKKTDLLLNLRNLDSEVAKFGFPSKLIEYMGSGIPILTTKVLRDDEFLDSVFNIEGYSSREIAQEILYIKEHHKEQEEKSYKAKQYVIKYNNWGNIGKEIYDFMKKIIKGEEIK